MDYGVVNFQWRVNADDASGRAWASFSNTYVITSDLPLGPDLAAEATSFAADLSATVRNVMGGPGLYFMLRTRTRQGGPFLEIDDELFLGAGGFTEIAPYWCTLMVRKYSGSPEKYRQGRIYLPFIGKPIGQSSFTAPYDTEFQYIADLFAQTFTSGTMVGVPVIHNREADAWEPVTRCDISPFLAFQRRRNASTRYYEFP